MDQTWIALLSGLAGAIIGSATSITTLWVQTRAEDRRRRREFYTGLAVEERKLRMDLMIKSGGGEIQPITIFVSHFHAVMNAIERGELTPAKMREIHRRDRELEAAIREDESAG
jgi:hypothetical protein